jgi:cholesterol transport system auxiliary component
LRKEGAAGGLRGAGFGPAAVAARAFLFACALVVAGCAAFKPAASTFDLTAPHEFPHLRGSSRAQLLIAEPSALKTLDAPQIVVKPAPNELEYLARAQWPDRLPKVVQSRLVETFENTRRIRAVSRPGEDLLIDYQLATDIRDFEADAAAGTAEVTLSVKLVSDRSGRVIATRIFTASVPLASTSPGVVVDALDLAFDKVARDIVNWTYRII